MRTATLAMLMALALGAMTTAVLWAHAQAEADDTPVILPSPAALRPSPGWLHLRNTPPAEIRHG